MRGTVQWMVHVPVAKVCRQGWCFWSIPAFATGRFSRGQVQIAALETESAEMSRQKEAVCASPSPLLPCFVAGGFHEFRMKPFLQSPILVL